MAVDILATIDRDAELADLARQHAGLSPVDIAVGWHLSRLAREEVRALIAERARLREALAGLLNHVDREKCAHEEVHRVGAIWTICDQCGMRLADGEGEFKPRQDATEVAAARTALATKEPQ